MTLRGMGEREGHFEQDSVSMTLMKVESPQRRLIFLVGTHVFKVRINIFCFQRRIGEDGDSEKYNILHWLAAGKKAYRTMVCRIHIYV